MVENIWQQGLYLVNLIALYDEGTIDTGQWNLAPSIILGIGLLVGGYFYGLRFFSPRYGRPSWLQISSFLLGILILFLALSSPLDVLSDEYLFSAHMVQHLLLAEIVPPLLLLGTPSWLIQPVLKMPGVARPARILTSPIPAFLIFNLCFWLWHLPALYDLALADERVHILQHLTFLVTGVLYWWPVLSQVPELPALSYPLQVAYLFASCIPGMLLGATFVFSSNIIYDSYLDAPRLFDISVGTDQLLGGLIMWIPGEAVYLLALSLVFLRWFRED